MKDRIVEHPGRYRLVPIPGQDGVFDLEPVPGSVTEVGTPICKNTLLSDETEEQFGLSNATVDDALTDLLNRAVSCYAYASDFFLYITGRHPFLNSDHIAGDYVAQNRNISLTGDAQTITVKDENTWGVR